MQIIAGQDQATRNSCGANMELTESAGQGLLACLRATISKDLAAINERIGKLIESYAADYRSKSMTTRGPKNSSGNSWAIEEGEAGLKEILMSPN